MLIQLRQRRKKTTILTGKRWTEGAKKGESVKSRWKLMTVRFVQVLKRCRVVEAFNSHQARKL